MIFSSFLRTVEPLDYHKRFLKENCRPDGRELGEFRTTTLNIGKRSDLFMKPKEKMISVHQRIHNKQMALNTGLIVFISSGSITTADGSALVKLGNTTIICGIKGELAAPPVDAANKGYIVPNVDLPPLCSSRFRPGPPGEQAQAASQFIADVIENTIIIVDPTVEEENLSTGMITVVTDEDEKLCAVHKPGGTALSGEKLQDCISRAITRNKEVNKLLNEVLISVKPK
ncbi:UNVERIFIED_CONTAM: hypothetical protein FKN15_071781 [Acipenser sinensis]